MKYNDVGDEFIEMARASRAKYDLPRALSPNMHLSAKPNSDRAQ